ncbi:MAG: TIGR03557 family F420-dependent LLM class oxidoreductase [Actinomycetota bacterium]|nr:TIGR03557 family F420-dependent LLM class oxidoreductase [Actinomycetota bacterium]
MTTFGYVLSCEEHDPRSLIASAVKAEQAGFSYGLISDHFHPWITRQGNSAFVWTVLGALARETSTMRIGTGVTCPTIRLHPAIVAHAAATCAVLFEDRFFLGVGSGENLNEHILGDPWPSVEKRHSMLEEAVELIRLLWKGGQRSFYGKHYTVENARLFTRPSDPPDIYMSAHGHKASALAGRIADGLIGVVASQDALRPFHETGGAGKPKLAQIKVCYAEDEDIARRTAREWWPTIALRGQLSQDLATPKHYESATKTVTEEHVAKAIVCGPDPDRHLELIARYVDVGYDHVTIHQVGPEQEAFLNFFEHELRPRV